MKIGDIQVDVLIDGECAVPAEMMYTNVDAERFSPYNNLLDPCTGHWVNTIGAFLVHLDERVILIEAGLGPKPTFPFVGGGLRSSLMQAGVSPNDITDVIYSHLHVDHIGWASVDGKSFFPNATHRMDKRDWDHFNAPDYTMPEWETMFQDVTTDPVPIRMAPITSQIEFFEGEQEIFPGLQALEASGHTPGSTVLRLESNGEEGLLIGDLVHTQPELFEIGWDSTSNVDSAAAHASIERMRNLILKRDIPFAAAHFPGMHWGKLVTSGGKVGYEELPD